MTQFLCRKQSSAAASALFLIAGLFAGLDCLAQPNSANTDKIRGDIYHHQKLKELPPGRSLADHQRLVYAAGMNGADLHREAIAIYLTNRLSRTEITALRAQAIELDPDLWIPPVPGHHPLGFHIGKARYESLPLLANDRRVVRVDSVEAQSCTQNDLGGKLIKSDLVHSGAGLNHSRDGAGVRIAIADTGVDLTHPDLSAPAEAYDLTDGDGVPNWGTSVANLVQNHGTHVVGTVLGNGSLSAGRYAGVAPGATWAFYKIGNDTTSTALIKDQVEAINRAASLGYQIFTMSFGGFTDFFMDGSGQMEQAIDSAVAGGMTVFISAGNSGNTSQHATINVAPRTTSGTFGFTVTNNAAGGPVAAQTIQVIWRDYQDGNQNITLSCNNLAAGESLNLVATATSNRGTDARQYVLTPNIGVAPNSQKTYNLALANAAASGGTPLVHCFAQNSGTFDTPDPAYTINSPALADGAIAVGAWVHRSNWVDFNGADQNLGQISNSLASFSSLGPRVDGRLKPDLVAPGSATISLLDANNRSFPTPFPQSGIIDNDGLNLNGRGPANYAVMQGTSMACPAAAGVAALVLQQNPHLTPARLKAILTQTARFQGPPNNSVGYGLIDARAAVREAETPSVWVDFAYAGHESGTFDEPFNTLAEGVAAVPVLPAGFAYPPRLRIKAGTSSAVLPLSKVMLLDSFGGTVTLGQ